MKFLHTKRVKIERLHLPGDWKKRLAAPHVQELASSLKDIPVLQPPGVRKDGKTIIWGHDRLAAMYIAGLKEVDVNVWDCGDDEATIATKAENAFRREADRQARKELVAIYTARYEEEDRLAREEKVRANYGGNGTRNGAQLKGAPEANRSPQQNGAAPARGRPTTPAGKAREAVAKATGVSKNRLEKELSEDRAKEKAQPTAPDAPPGPLEDFETWGLPVSIEMRRQVIDARAVIEELANRLTAAVTATTRVADQSGVLASELELQHMRRELQHFGALARGQWPVAICPSCKLVPDLLTNCRTCRQVGTVGKAKMSGSVPPELLKGGEDAGVFTGPNEFTRLSELG